MSEQTLKPCPFCGGGAKLTVSDREGNSRMADYENDPYSGLSFKISHVHEQNKGCPIANYECDDASMGVYLYGSREEAIEAWNTRHVGETE
ncbi:hypothetical protein J40TS1_00210 [Paenibacillus montaniterrae]|uniref:Lar family restriction alleviation protein n=1 Tax=Paenibacillus montaniterrae TaxID=429341 RepID=A0A920CWT9_9BACL|nr:Lar family restriction alleviation protein [Paenibacillus montaniterrae]GIP14379.1 hypothetical protein J40TS1_00210 [Paenibacillus montaniterrae]